MNFDSRLSKAARKMMVDELSDLHETLGNGAPLNDTFGNISVVYARYVGRIEGLKQALSLLDKAEDDISERKDRNQS